MSNNLALFVTHHVFLTDDQIMTVVSGESLTQIGHCVPVWINAKTGKTTEPAKEVFCLYEISVSGGGPGDVDLIDGKGYRVVLPRNSAWSPPEPINFKELSSLGESERERFLRERDEWWFLNPRHMDFEDLGRGYLRFEVKKQKLKLGRRSYSAQHILEISRLSGLSSSLTS